jgi:hypothetical protein
MIACSNMSHVSLGPWVTATGNLLLMEALYWNILAVNPAPKPTRQKLHHLLIVIFHAIILLVETDRVFASRPVYIILK